MTVVDALVADHWRRPADVTDALEVLGILGVLNAAGAKNALDQVREELFQVRYFLAHHREVRVRLSDTSKGNSHERGDIATKLFGERVSVWTMRLRAPRRRPIEPRSPPAQPAQVRAVGGDHAGPPLRHGRHGLADERGAG